MIYINGRHISANMYENFKACSIENNLWYNDDGSLAPWDVAFHGLGFKSYKYCSEPGFEHYIDDVEYTLFVLRFS